MAGFAWNENYSVEVARADAQHQQLFAIINTLAETLDQHRGPAALREIIRELAAAARAHFQMEETLMQQTGYPSLSAHHQQHQRFLAEVEQHRRDLEEGRRTNSAAVVEFLKEWLVQHIQVMDMAYSDHLHGHGIH